MKRRSSQLLQFVLAITVIKVFAMPSLLMADPKPPSNQEFLEQIHAHWQKLPARANPSQAGSRASSGTRTYLPLQDLIRGQSEISVDNILAKLQKRIDEHDIEWNKKHQRWDFNHDHGQSSVALDDPIQVVKGPQGYVITDGHHDFFLALYLGASTIAVEVKEDLSDLSPKDFWKALKDQRQTYLPESPSELAKNLPEMCDIKDNPNRYFASLIALKVEMKNGEIKKVKGAKNPVWVKVNDGVSFVEFYIAQALSKAGINYQSEWQENIPEESIEKARDALSAAQLAGVPVITSESTAKALRHDDFQLKTFIDALSPRQCGSAFD